MNQLTKVVLLDPILAIVAVMACTSGGSKPTFQPIPTPTTPPGFVKYSDELSSFSIEYPREWELATSQMAPLTEGYLKDLFEGKLDNLLDFTAIVFIAGDREAGNSVNISVASLPSKLTLDEYYETGAASAKEMISSFQIHRISKVQVDGKSAVLHESSYEASDLDPSSSGSISQTSLVFILGKSAWTLTCTYRFEPGFAQTCESIVRTMKIL